MISAASKAFGKRLALGCQNGPFRPYQHRPALVEELAQELVHVLFECGNREYCVDQADLLCLSG